MAETNGLLNRRTSQGVPGVRIPPSPHHRGVAQLVSAPALGAGGRGFESHLPDQILYSVYKKILEFLFFQADVAELAYALALGASGFYLGGSNPFIRTINEHITYATERSVSYKCEFIPA